MMLTSPPSGSKAADNVVALAVKISEDESALSDLMASRRVTIRSGRWPISATRTGASGSHFALSLKAGSWVQADLFSTLLLALRLALRHDDLGQAQALFDTIVRKNGASKHFWPYKRLALLAMTVDDPWRAHDLILNGSLKVSNSKQNGAAQHLLALSSMGDLRSLVDLLGHPSAKKDIRALRSSPSHKKPLLDECLLQSLAQGLSLDSRRSRSLLSHGSALPREESSLESLLFALSKSSGGLRAMERALANSHPKLTISPEVFSFIQKIILDREALKANKNKTSPPRFRL